MLLIFVAGGLGAITRYGLSSLIGRGTDGPFPWGILAVNAVGCLVFGLVYALVEDRGSLSPDVRLIILVGFAGAFTTFSTFAFDTAQLARSGDWFFAVGNVVLNNAVGIGMVVVGFGLAKVTN
ncbi:MAG: fluoride efflux transporter CrcB [Chloroflexi bacterium]|nr:fluoride efflux transporter CrcB [Chloroflexota bacterium]